MGDIVEGKWDCPLCGSKGILGRHRTCTHCKKPRGKVKFYFGSSSEIASLPAVTDAQVLAEAKAGPDWYCGVCGGGSSATVSTCMHCGADQSLSETTDVLVKPARFAPEYWADTPYQPKKRWLSPVVMGVFVAVNLILWLWWGFQEHDVVGQVVSWHWEHRTVRDHWSEVVRSDWESGLSPSPVVMPVNGRGERGGVQNIRHCRQEIHHYERYECGTERACSMQTRSVSCGTEESCSVVDHGNGYGERTCSTVTMYCSESYEECHDETKYCERPIYATKCDYDTWVWLEAESRTTSGEGDKVYWVEITPGERDRLRKLGTYEVGVEYVDRDEVCSHTLELSELDTYLKWNQQEAALLTVNNFGGVTAVRFVK